MSLQVWLPLNGNTSNQGLNGLYMTGSPGSWGDGKIGKCATFNGNLIYNNTTELNYTDNFSYCLWINQNYSGAVAEFAFTVGRAATGGYGYGIQIHSASTIGLWFGSRAINISCPANEWHHIAFTVSGTVIKVYKDGALLTTSTTQTLPTYSDGKGLGLGYFHYSAEDIYPYHGSLNDFRIYDHCLSAKEVKEISKGLICHYKLDNKGFGNSNLTPANLKYSKNSSSSDGWFFMSGSAFTCKPSTTYTISIDIDGTISPFHGGSSSTDATKKYAAIWLYICKTGTSTNATSGGYDTPVWMGSTNYNFRKIGETRYAWTYTTPSDARTLALRGNTYSNDSTPIEVNFWNPKIEEGAVATQWCPHSSNSLYITLDLNSTTEEDCSGLRNNGTLSEYLPYVSDSPRYDGCYYFNSASKRITLPAIPMSGFSNSFSISWWGKAPSYSGIMYWGFSDGNRLNYYCGSYCNTGDGYDNPYYSPNTTTTISAPSVDAWHHFVMVGDGSSNKLYVDGELYGVAKAYRGITGSTIVINGWDSSTDYKTNGYISDFRIYSTALSSSDIKELYNTPASVDKNGTMYAYEFKEE